MKDGVTQCRLNYIEQHHNTHNTTMPGVITVPDFIREAKEDFASPTTSTFVNRIPQCRETINRIDEVENVPFIITVL